MTVFLEVKNQHKRFAPHHRKGAEITVFKDFNLELSKGECVVLHGQSGRGKSTLLRCLHGNYLVNSGHIMLHQDSGPVSISGLQARTMLGLRKNTIGYVSQSLRALPRVTTLDVVAEPLLAARADLTEISDQEHQQAWDLARKKAAVLPETTATALVAVAIAAGHLFRR